MSFSGKWLLPRLAWIGIWRNKETYIPYIGAGIFSVFLYFVFLLISNNDIMYTLPRASYVMVLMLLGSWLLAVILILFFLYTNRFLMKRRAKELGLYSILGLEKKHIGILLFIETGIIYTIALLGGVVWGLVFSKLIFLILLNMARIPLDTSFQFSIKALVSTLLFFAAAYGFNLMVNLYQVMRSKPGSLFQDGKKGEKETKHPILTTIVGIALLLGGYSLSLTSQLDGTIFSDFFLAIFFVIFGTHCFFRSGLGFLLKVLKKRETFYYKKNNYVTLAGMSYRTKKSASSLSNLCIFSTMVIITLLCTISLAFGMKDILLYRFPYDVEMNFLAEKIENREGIIKEGERIAEQNNVSVSKETDYFYTRIKVERKGNTFLNIGEDANTWEKEGLYEVRLLTEEEFQRVEEKGSVLKEGEIFTFSDGKSMKASSLKLADTNYIVKEEFETFPLVEKREKAVFGEHYFIVVKDREEIEKLLQYYGQGEEIFNMRMCVTGGEEEKQKFAEQMESYGAKKEGMISGWNGAEQRLEILSMNGGLIFLGIFLGIAFLIFLLIIMYYKQITEGYDDRENFMIMEKVGMTDEDVKGTIKRQVQLVFYLPLFLAFCHTAIALPMIHALFGAISLFQEKLVFFCGLGSMGFFFILYAAAYRKTAKVYYKIVKHS